MERHLFTVRYGLYSFAGIATLFLLMKLFGLENVTYLRLLNLVIVLFFSNRLAKINHRFNKDLDYFEALISLILANLLTVALSIIGFAIYAGLIDKTFIQHFESGVFWGGHLTLKNAIMSLLMEGIAGSVIVSFILMQYWQTAPRNKHKSPVH